MASWIATPLTLSICPRRSVVEAVVGIVHGVADALRVAAICLAQVVDVAVDEVALVALEAGSRLPIHSSENVVVFPDPVIAADIVAFGVQVGYRNLGFVPVGGAGKVRNVSTIMRQPEW
jgi:energy-converting hydrogenase Eha subunit A